LLLDKLLLLQTFALSLTENLLEPGLGWFTFLKGQFSLTQCFLQRLKQETYLFSLPLCILELLLNLALLLLLADLILLLLLLISSLLEFQLALCPSFFFFLAFLQLALLPLESFKAGLFFEFGN
jgi:hypothetical protein